MSVPKPFTFKYYSYLLESAIDRGYKVTSFEKFSPNAEKTLIMRHDVDYTLNGVIQLAEIESKLGVTSTFLFRVHAHEYNIFTPHVFRLIRDLRASGHEIGLHFEAMTFGRALALHPPDVLLKEKAVLETVAEISLRTASEHRDISHFIHSTPHYHELYDPLAAGFSSYALEPRFFKDMKYLSESNGVWREGDPLQHYGKHQRLQVLIHPDWWFEEDLLLKGPYFHGLGN
jgi:hypothetical protein